MKAIIKETGEIIDVERLENPCDLSDYCFIDNDKRHYSPIELDFGSCGHSKEIDWDRVRIQIAIAVMCGQYSNKDMMVFVGNTSNDPIKTIAELSVRQANALIEELKK